MKVYAQDMNSHLSRTASTRLTDDQLQRYEGIECWGNIFMRQAFIDYNSKQEMCRPYLKLIGEVRSIKGDFPYGVSEVTFGEDSRLCPKVEYWYDLSNNELEKLCEKGLFDNGFGCPDIFFDNYFELPMTCSCNAIVPEYDGDVPLLFVKIDNQYDIQTSSVLSGYPIADYFESPKQTQNEFMEDMESQFEDTVHMHDLFEKKEPVQEKEEPVIVQMTPEEKLLNEALENIEERVDTKLQAVEQEKAERQQAFEEAQENEQMDVEDDAVEEEIDEYVETERVVQENLEVNEDEDSISSPKTVPTNLQDIADRADEDLEYVSDDEFGDAL